MEFALQLLATMQHTESVELDVKLMRFGTSLFVGADVFLDTILLEEYALNATLKLKSTIKSFNAVIVSMDIRRYQDRDAMESVLLSVTSTKIGFLIDVCVNLDTS